ncbi:MAG TPA: biotin/lipoyl-containing protein [candidate division Zixibacteria bacterium]|jgi:3-methylcrotonyl-CoA carboxylase alpha subunit
MSWVIVECDGKRSRFAVVRTPRGVWVGWPGRGDLISGVDNHTNIAHRHDDVRAPMTGRVITVAAKAGARVAKGDLLVVLEAMKMEYRLTAPHDGIVEAVHCAEGELVDLGASLVTLTQSK